ncbi:hypothetical protein DTO027B9_3630 [Paecilomyces variotii]|nr:hypothetical protein DTO027B9_3630 [Paecilomyces variotii]
MGWYGPRSLWRALEVPSGQQNGIQLPKTQPPSEVTRPSSVNSPLAHHLLLRPEDAKRELVVLDSLARRHRNRRLKTLNYFRAAQDATRMMCSCSH